MQWSAPSARARSSFASLDDVMIARAPAIFAICSAKIDTPPVPSESTVSPGLQASRAVHQRVPDGHAGARQRRGLLERQMRRQLQQAVGLKHGVLGQRAVERKAERGRRIALRERRDDAIADLELRDAGADAPPPRRRRPTAGSCPASAGRESTCRR